MRSGDGLVPAVGTVMPRQEEEATREKRKSRTPGEASYMC
jgi:hypothetical protein